jgi:hypothetical protein
VSIPKVWWSESAGALIDAGLYELGPGDPQHYRTLPADAVELLPAPSSLRAELAEAKATIARYQGVLAEAAGTIRRLERELAEDLPIVEAATALVKYRRDPGPNPTRLELERRIAAVDDAVTAVEEGNRT